MLSSVFVRLLLVGLDLGGIFLIGVVVSLISGTTIARTSPLSVALRWFDSLGFSNGYAVILGIAICFFILKGVLAFCVTYLTASYVARLEAAKAGEIYVGLFNSDLDSVERYGHQEILHGLTTSIYSAFAQTIVIGTAIVGELGLLLGVAIYLALSDLILFLCVAAFFGAVGLAMHSSIGRLSGKFAQVQNDSLLKTQAVVLDSLANFRQLAISGRVTFFASEFLRSRSQTSRAASIYSTLSTLPRYITEIAVMLGVGILVIQRAFAGSSNLSAATIAIFLAGIFRIVASMLPLQSALSSLKRVEHEARIGFELADKYIVQEPKTSSFTSNLESAQVPYIQFQNVSFRHSVKSKWVLRHVSFSLERGDYLALMGRSGSGKSSIADLIMGLRSPVEGQILIDGQSPKAHFDANPFEVAYVPQDTQIVRGTLLENITMRPGEEVHDPSKLYRAIQQAQLSEFIATLPDGLHTMVGQGAMALSGGQAQRIGLARALYVSPSLLVLDEATSALDQETEDSVALALQKLKGSVTFVVIAHRPATLNIANKSLHLTSGKSFSPTDFKVLHRDVG